MTTLAYIRISTEGQEDGTGLDVQQKQIIAYAAANGITVDGWHQDIESGAKPTRLGLDALRAAIAAGNVSTVLVYRLDRIARDVLIAETLYREWQRAGRRAPNATYVWVYHVTEKGCSIMTQNRSP